MAEDSKGNLEASVIGAGFGGVFGGLTIGAAADLLALPGHTMAFYAVGVVLGSIAGLIAGRIAAAALL